MLNYIKSELYRIARQEGVYVFGGICAGLLVLMNIVLAWIKWGDPTFRYGSTWFVFGFVDDVLGMVFVMTIIMGCLVFGDEYKDRTIGNSIAFGDSPVMVYLGKIIVSLIVSVITLAAVVAIFVGSAYLLLEDSGPTALWEFLRDYLANSLFLVQGVLAALTFCFLSGSKGAATWIWLAVYEAFPMVVSLLGLKFPFFSKLDGWLAGNLAGSHTYIGKEAIAFWQTPEGLMKLLVAGCSGIVIFLLLGILGVRRKEL